MKKIILFFLFLSFTSLFAMNEVDTFIEKQLHVEAQLLDSNVSAKEKNHIIKKQTQEYRTFFLSYASMKEDNLNQVDTLKSQIRKLKISYRKSINAKKSTAALKDEILLKTLQIESAIKGVLLKSLHLTSSKSQDFYKDKLSEEIVNIYIKNKPIEKSKYFINNSDTNNTIIAKLVEPLKRLDNMSSVANTFSFQLLDNSNNIYKTALLSESKFFSLMDNINRSPMGQDLNKYLIYVNLDTGKAMSLLILIVLIILVQMLIIYISEYLCKYYNMSESDIKYINEHITKIFIWLTTLLIIHLVLVMFVGFETNAIAISKIFGIAYVILISLIIIRSTDSFAYFKMKSIKDKTHVKDEVFNLSIKGIYGLIVIIATIAILKILGIDLTALLSGLGIAGAAVAFAAKDTIANVFGSIAILAGDVFEQGDWIETSSVEGTVVEIGLRTTTVRTFDNALISVPNVELADNDVKNWSRRSIGRRIKMNIGVTYESDFDDIKQAISDIKLMLKENPSIANEHTSFISKYRQAKLVSTEDLRGIKRTTLVYLDEFSDSSINILVYCFTRTVNWNEWLAAKEDVMFKIADILKKNNLEFAYPTMTLHQANKPTEKIEAKED